MADPSDPVDSWLIDRIAYLRNFGFFRGAVHSDLPTFLATPDMEDLRALFHHNPQHLTKDHADFWLLCQDQDRVLSLDLETDDHEGDDFYVDLVQSICRISRVPLPLTNIAESWSHVSDRMYAVTIRFNHLTTPFQLVAQHDADWADVAGLFGLLDSLLHSYGHRLWYVSSDGPHIGPHMVVMTPSERASLESCTHLRFTVARRSLPL